MAPDGWRGQRLGKGLCRLGRVVGKAGQVFLLGLAAAQKAPAWVTRHQVVENGLQGLIARLGGHLKQRIAQAHGRTGTVVLGQLIRIEAIENQGQTVLYLLGKPAQRFDTAAAVSLGVVGQQLRYFVGALHETACQTVALVQAGQLHSQHQRHRTQVHLLAGIHRQVGHQVRVVASHAGVDSFVKLVAELQPWLRPYTVPAPG